MALFLQQLINGLSIGAIYALIAVGYTMVYGVLRLINFAHGEVYMIGAMMGVYLASWYGIVDAQGVSHPSWFGFLAVLVSSMLICAIVGFLIELLAYRPMRHRPRIESLITAIGVSMFLSFGGQAVFGATPETFPKLIPGVEENPVLVRFFNDQVSIDKVDALIIVVTLVLMLLLRHLVLHTRTGLALRAVSFRFDTSSLMGININRIVSLTFVIGSMLAAAAGVLIALRSPKVEPLMGVMMGLKAFVAAVLGGIGNIPGAVAGGLLLGLTEAMVQGYIEQGSQYKEGVAFVILIGVLLIRPTGLFGQNVVEKA